MPSPVRARVEVGLRAVAFAALAAIIWLVIRTRLSPAAEAASTSTLSAALVRWSTETAPARVRIVFDSAPSPGQRDWLQALARAGTVVSWGGKEPSPTGVSVDPVPDPRHPSRVWVAAPKGAIKLSDDLGLVDSAAVQGVGALVVVPHLHGVLRVVLDSVPATTMSSDSLVLRPVLVLGQASWEAKYALAALEEVGWKVDARLAVAPSGDVRQGPARIIMDTSRYAAIVVLDSIANRFSAQLARYVKDGGGVIALGAAAGLPQLAPILPAAVVDPPTLPGAFAQDLPGGPRSALALEPLGKLKNGAAVLETRASAGRQVIAAAAWQLGQGRVVQIGYDDTWRWRLAGAEADPVLAHREWWATLVSSVAYAPRVQLKTDTLLEPTPLASFIGSLGHSSPELPGLARRLADNPRLIPILFAVLLAAFLAEWTSRRLRALS